MTDEQLLYKMETLSRYDFSEFLHDCYVNGLITTRQLFEFKGE
ncbi:hypothetical protein P113G_0053 [Lactococcus lactis phage P113G]|jgi:hypothetical protein|uniref:Middle expressed protein 1 n=2 Tax=Skunavirus p272 TaxID=2845476 RepID=R9R1N5_9CAUD|nr:hypothetical protein HYO74_gp56 [Lactococcus lactis phage p272]AGI11007.1 hypothetical protein P113G_0053 [Lactococcus lactis phage P113G]AGI11068.1 hypothetical protein P272_0056 [Lactococcus lactis phage p272]